MSHYADAVESLYALGAELASAPGKPRRKFDLEHMRRLAAALGHPERRFPSVLIAGTNGKGSTAATLASILQASGYRTALYTSPHLVRVNERIRINGQAIADDRFADVYRRVREVSEELLAKDELPQIPSFFETVTAMAFLHFAEQAVEIAVLEVGLGGRLDATNIVEPLVSVITDIDLDHQQWLGHTIPEIAREKAGIMRPNGPVVLLPQHPQANQALGEVAISLGARAVNATEYLPNTTPGEALADGQSYTVTWNGAPLTVQSPLIGRHQWRNIALALAAAAELQTNFGFARITPITVDQGIVHTRWPGRFQRLRCDGHDYVVDVAHNPAGAWALRSALTHLYDDRPLTLVFGGMQDKDIESIAGILFPIADRVVLTRADSPRAAAPEELQHRTASFGTEALLSVSVREALTLAEGITPAGGAIVVTGSVFVVGEALAELAPESMA